MTDPTETCRKIVEETHQFYRERHLNFRNRGYHVMYGPASLKPPVMFVGYQPGGEQITDDHVRQISDHQFPQQCSYATEQWRLALAMQSMWGVDLLAQTTGLNAIFFRSPETKIYRKEVTLAQRREAAGFCLPRVRQIVEAVAPKLVVAIGLETLRVFCRTTSALVNDSNRTLAEFGTIASIKAIGTLHLSGAHISTVDRQRIAALVASHL